VDLNSVGKKMGHIENTLNGEYKLTGIPRDSTAEDSDTDNKMVQVIASKPSRLMMIPHAKLHEILEKDTAMTTGLLRLYHERLLAKVLVRDKMAAVQTYASSPGKRIPPLLTPHTPHPTPSVIST
jgi:hypothetical protein